MITSTEIEKRCCYVEMLENYIRNSMWFSTSNAYPTFYLAMSFEIKEKDRI